MLWWHICASPYCAQFIPSNGGRFTSLYCFSRPLSWKPAFLLTQESGMLSSGGFLSGKRLSTADTVSEASVQRPPNHLDKLLIPSSRLSVTLEGLALAPDREMVAYWLG